MISEIFCTSSRSETIFHKRYRFDLVENCSEIFAKKLRNESPQKLVPQFSENGINYYHIKRNNVYIVAVSKSAQPLLIMEILTRLHQLIKDFCGSFTEDSLKSNIILIYELLDEYLDYGHVQLSSVDKLKPYIQSDPVSVRTTRTHQNMTSGLFGVEYRAPAAPDSAEKPVIRSQRDQENRGDEIFLDVVERISFLMEPNGDITRYTLNGGINMKCFISIGSPKIQIALNEDLLLRQEQQQGYNYGLCLEEYTLHDCVDKEKFKDSKELVIQPPQGEFTMMTYSLADQFLQNPPVKIHFQSHALSRREFEFTVKLRANIPDNAEIINLSARITLPKCVQNISLLTKGSQQTLQYHDKDGYIMWTLKRILGGQDTSAKFKAFADFETKPKPEVGPIILDFEISGHVTSGLTIKYLRLNDPNGVNTRPHRWIRYITVPDSYIVNVNWA